MRSRDVTIIIFLLTSIVVVVGKIDQSVVAVVAVVDSIGLRAVVEGSVVRCHLGACAEQTDH